MFLYIVCYSVFLYNMLFNCITKWKLAFGLICVYLHFLKINVFILWFIFLVYSFHHRWHISQYLGQFFYTLHSDRHRFDTSSTEDHSSLKMHSMTTSFIFSQLLFSLKQLQNLMYYMLISCLHTLFKTINLKFKT